MKTIRHRVALLGLTILAAQAVCAPAFGQANAPAASKGKNEPAAKPASLSIDKRELKFDKEPAGSTSPVQTVSVTVEPSQDSSTKITATTAGDFSVAPASCDLKGSGKCAFSVSFAPKTEGQSTSALTITTAGEMANLPATVDLKGEGIPCGQCAADERPEFFTAAWWLRVCPVLLVMLLYLAGIILIRWHMIARPSRNLLKAAIEGVRARVESLKGSILPVPPGLGPALGPSIEQIEGLLAKADEFIRDQNPIFMLPDYLFWNRGQEISAWSLVHEAEEEMALIYPQGYEPYVRADLEQAKLELGQSGSDVAKGMADLIGKALNPDQVPPVPFERLKALLNDALGFLYDQTDTKFSTMISWQNKTVWLTGCAILLIVSLGAALQHEVFFLVGGTGGLLSRLSRSLQRADVPTDYGASWTTLFLSPVVGALAGWSGVLLLILGSQLNIVGSALKVDWCNSYCAVALGLALLLGTSERAFSGVLNQLESKVAASSDAKPAQKSGATKAS